MRACASRLNLHAVTTVEIFHRLGLALAIGFLVGVERGWKQRFAEEGSRVAGLRTYALIGLYGGVAGLLGAELGALAFLALALGFSMVWTLYKAWETWVDSDLSVTGAIAGFVTFSLGAYAVAGDARAAGAAGVALVAILAFKRTLHERLRALGWEELRSALAILAASAIALPLLPERALDPYGAFNPRELWVLTIVIAGASFAGYAALRLLGPRAGLYAGAAIGALVSSTIVTLDLARRAKAGQSPPARARTAATLANAVMFARVGVLIGVFATPALAKAAPALAAAIAASLIAAAIGARAAGKQGDAESSAALHNPLDFAEVVRLALVLGAVVATARLLTHFFGHASLIAFAAGAGLVDVDAVALSVGALVRDGLSPHAAAQAILTAALVDTVSKSAIAAAVGRRDFWLPYAAASFCAALAGGGAYLLVS